MTDNVVISGDPIRRFHPPGAAFWIDRANRVELQNCLVADNPRSDSPHASGLVGQWVDGGGNVIGGPAGLDYLRDHGGPTLSLLPLPGSPAIDVGVASDLLVDASGVSGLQWIWLPSLSGPPPPPIGLVHGESEDLDSQVLEQGNKRDTNQKR